MHLDAREGSDFRLRPVVAVREPVLFLHLFTAWGLHKRMIHTEKTYTVTYTETMVRSAVRTFVWRRGIVGHKGLWFAEIVLVTLFFWLLARGDRGWEVGLFGAILLAPPTLIMAAWLAHYRNTVGKFRSMQRPIANVTIGPNVLAMTSELGSAEIPWSSLTEIWDCSTYWMLFTAASQFFTIPIETISTEERDFVKSKIGSSREAAQAGAANLQTRSD